MNLRFEPHYIWMMYFSLNKLVLVLLKVEKKVFSSTAVAIRFISNHLFLRFQHYELILSEERVSVIQRGQGGEVPFTVRYIGMYTVIDTTSGLILMWDKKTSIFIKLSAEFKVRN